MFILFKNNVVGKINYMNDSNVRKLQVLLPPTNIGWTQAYKGKKMFSKKKAVVASLILMAFVTSGTVNSATGDKVNKIINISATVPSATFSVEPIFGQWPTDIELQYDTTAKTFNSYQLRLEATTAVGLTAQLQTAAKLVNGTTKVPMTVKLNEKALGSIPISIVHNANSKNPSEKHIIDLSIETTGTHEIVGLYAGVVNMVFEDKF